MRTREGMNLIKTYCKHLWKCHNVPLYNNNMLIAKKNYGVKLIN
jgi:hypothetical protein